MSEAPVSVVPLFLSSSRDSVVEEGKRGVELATTGMDGRVW